VEIQLTEDVIGDPIGGDIPRREVVDKHAVVRGIRDEETMVRRIHYHSLRGTQSDFVRPVVRCSLREYRPRRRQIAIVLPKGIHGILAVTDARNIEDGNATGS